MELLWVLANELLIPHPLYEIPKMPRSAEKGFLMA